MTSITVGYNNYDNRFDKQRNRMLFEFIKTININKYPKSHRQQNGSIK